MIGVNAAGTVGFTRKGLTFRPSEIPYTVLCRYRRNKVLLQRLYSNFANGWPGCGLFLLRLAAFLFLIQRCFVGRSLNDHGVWISALAGMAGILLLAGLWTPFAGIISSLSEIWIAIRTGDDPSAYLLAAAIGAGLTLLGPGSWSIDARLFGRR